jgi:hypothetical protein
MITGGNLVLGILGLGGALPILLQQEPNDGPWATLLFTLAFYILPFGLIGLLIRIISGLVGYFAPSYRYKGEVVEVAIGLLVWLLLLVAITVATISESVH